MSTATTPKARPARRLAALQLVGIVAPLTHGLIAFGLGSIAHVRTGFSPGGIVLLSVMAASSSDISGPPTLRAGIPSANPSAYVGASTSVGTPVAIVSDSFANIKIEIITADPEVAKRIADEVAAKYFDNYSGITYLDQVEVHRLNMFRSPTG